MRSRSSPSASCARTSNVSVPFFAPTSTFATGFAFRLWYHPGWSGAPPFDAMTTYRSPSRWYITGVMGSSPLRAPTVVRRIRCSPNGPIPLPALEWNSWMVAAFQSAIATSLPFYRYSRPISWISRTTLVFMIASSFLLRLRMNVGGKAEVEPDRLHDPEHGAPRVNVGRGNHAGVLLDDRCCAGVSPG